MEKIMKCQDVCVKETAKANFSSGFNCAESVLAAVAKKLKMKSSLIPKAAAGFGAGVGKHGDICGALSGAIIAMGMAEGRTDPKDNESKAKIYARIALLMKEFKRKFEHTTCRDLTGCNLLTKEGQDKFSNYKIHEQVCPEFVAFAAEKVLELIGKDKQDC